MCVRPSVAHISHRCLKRSSDAARLGFGSMSPVTPHAPDTGFSPRSVKTRRAVASESVFRKSSSRLLVISTCVIPAFAHPSSDGLNPARADVFWCNASVILPAAASAVRWASRTAGVRSMCRLESMASPYSSRTILAHETVASHQDGRGARRQGATRLRQRFGEVPPKVRGCESVPRTKADDREPGPPPRVVCALEWQYREYLSEEQRRRGPATRSGPSRHTGATCRLVATCTAGR